MIRTSVARKRVPHLAIGGLLLIIGLLLVVIPPEKTLGPIIRPVFLHGALVQVGLIDFAAAACLGLYWLIVAAVLALAAVVAALLAGRSGRRRGAA